VTRNLFIVSPRFDGGFFFASVLVVVAAWIAAAQFHVDGFLVLAIVAVFSNGPHLASTWTRVYMDRREWRERPWAIFGVPAAITCFVFSWRLFAGDRGRLLNTILLYWATWHFLAQNWGLLRIYQRRSGEPDETLARRLEKPLLFASVLWCLLHRLRTGPWSLFGTTVYHLRPRAWVLDVLGAAFITSAALLLALRVFEKDRDLRRSGLLRLGFLGCAFVGFFVPFVVMTRVDGTTAFAAAACWHGFQYLGIVRFYHKNAWQMGVHSEARAISWLSQPGAGRFILYCTLLLGLAGAGYVVIFAGALLTRKSAWDVYAWGASVWLSLTFSHYWLDGVIWKLRRDHTVATRLLLSGGA
jgi:hypothetical protein